ncbi:MAG: hypothetical protein QF569_24710 [Candidatus Poribacteria bacterium]|nr:hypothetical protein [Candidatus Poribacteria bacterium]
MANPFWTLPDEEPFFFEQPIYLDYALGFYLHQIQLAVSPLPAKGNGFLTFGCLNRWQKISAGTLSLWARLLLAIPNSRLILKALQLANESLRLSILGQMQEYGVNEERIDLRGGSSQQEHSAAYQEIDISLDTGKKRLISGYIDHGCRIPVSCRPNGVLRFNMVIFSSSA